MATQATQDDLFLAILALDAYNRDYNLGMKGADGTTHIGDAKVGIRADTPAYKAASFYAVEYEWKDKTVISYRGSDDPLGELCFASPLGERPARPTRQR